MIGTPVDRSITFSAAGSQRVALSGRFIRILSADVSGVTITPEGASPLLRYGGQEIDVGPQGFRSFQVAVTVPCTVILTVSETHQSDNQTNVNATVSATIDPGGTLPTGGDTVCATGAATLLAAGNANNLAVMVRSSELNNYAAGTVRVGGTGVTAASGIEINPGEVMTLSTTAPVYAYNNSGAAVTLQVLPIQK